MNPASGARDPVLCFCCSQPKEARLPQLHPADVRVTWQTIKYLRGSEEGSFSLLRLESQRVEKEEQKHFSRVPDRNKTGICVVLYSLQSASITVFLI